MFLERLLLQPKAKLLDALLLPQAVALLTLELLPRLSFLSLDVALHVALHALLLLQSLPALSLLHAHQLPLHLLLMFLLHLPRPPFHLFTDASKAPLFCSPFPLQGLGHSTRLTFGGYNHAFGVEVVLVLAEWRPRIVGGRVMSWCSWQHRNDGEFHSCNLIWEGIETDREARSILSESGNLGLRSSNKVLFTQLSRIQGITRIFEGSFGLFLCLKGNLGCHGSATASFHTCRESSS
mmetsp:Transcript_28599/g.54670  ORF Transcript_28599/g.54670 Transcript_28599/m.54670 type:complete len:237 (+) Transcript_28599:3724-4434(+)